MRAHKLSVQQEMELPETGAFVWGARALFSDLLLLESTWSLHLTTCWQHRSPDDNGAQKWQRRKGTETPRDKV